jgi:hypothetical protein
MSAVCGYVRTQYRQKLCQAPRTIRRGPTAHGAGGEGSSPEKSSFRTSRQGRGLPRIYSPDGLRPEFSGLPPPSSWVVPQQRVHSLENRSHSCRMSRGKRGCRMLQIMLRATLRCWKRCNKTAVLRGCSKRGEFFFCNDALRQMPSIIYDYGQGAVFRATYVATCGILLAHLGRHESNIT